MSDKLLVKFECNWADEFDVYGFALYTREKWDNYVKLVNEYHFDKPIEVYFGTNEFLEFDEAELHLDCFEVHEISEEVYFEMKKIFGNDFGNFITIEDHINGHYD